MALFGKLALQNYKFDLPPHLLQNGYDGESGEQTADSEKEQEPGDVEPETGEATELNSRCEPSVCSLSRHDNQHPGGGYWGRAGQVTNMTLLLTIWPSGSSMMKPSRKSSRMLLRVELCP